MIIEGDLYMRTLLINPETPRIHNMGGANSFPLGLGYIAAVLEKDHNIEVIDMGAEKLNDDSLMDKISEINPEIIGISANTLSFQNAIQIGKKIKQIDNEIMIVIGGAHSNAMPTDPLKYKYFDISVYGEGERTVVELWDKIEKGKSYDDVKGIAFRKNDKITVNPRQELIENLDNLPFPARHLFPMKKYSEEFSLYVSPIYSVGTSRGCPFSCAFCSNNVIFGRTYRTRSPENIVNEIEHLIDGYGVKGIYFREDIFTMNSKRVYGICDEINKRDLDFKWICESRVNTINQEMLRSMKKAGCELIWFGVESGSQRVLDLMHKQITLSQSRNAFSLCKKIKLKAGGSFLIGIPGEKKNESNYSALLAESLRIQTAIKVL